MAIQALAADQWSRLGTILLCFGLFAALGVPEGMLGVAWPVIRGDFGLPLEALGQLTLVATAAYLLSSFGSSPLLQRFGLTRLLLASCVVRGAGLLGFALAPNWYTLMAFGFLVGLGGGLLDAAVNTFFAFNFSPRLRNWVHASFGFGATIGPILLVALMSRGQGWMMGYLVVGVMMGILARFVFFNPQLLQEQRLSRAAAATETEAIPPAPLGVTLRQPIVLVSILLFFVYTGLEITAANWPPSLFMEVRGVDMATTGWWASGYWWAFTLSRVVFGFIGGINPATLLRTTLSAACVGAAMLWWNPINLVGFLGLALLGFMIAPLFPLLTAITPERMGAAHAANAIGLQVAASAFGIGVMPALAGVLAARIGLEVIGPFILASVVLVLGLNELSNRSSS